ncbi:hypothetical protein RhiJN_03542 [Ceratobasidium sp. AG-Ba]|nr:hypothetical protein RhiJN_03542 [Ceratobasidium sp. AG-Ba]
MGRSDSESESESGRHERSQRQEKRYKKEKERRDRDSDSDDEKKKDFHRREDDDDRKPGFRERRRRSSNGRDDHSEEHAHKVEAKSHIATGHGYVDDSTRIHHVTFPQIPYNPATGPRTGTSGRRVPVAAGEAFPRDSAGPAPPFIWEGEPAYVGSALLGDQSVQPCRITPSRVSMVINGDEAIHSGRYDLLPLTDAMEWVPASGGAVPLGRQVVEGGFECGSPLYHAAARVNGTFTPGKAGPAIGGAQIPANGRAKFSEDEYYVLCWKE